MTSSTAQQPAPLATFTRAQVAASQKPSVLVVVNDLVYDLTEFVSDHPGGEAFITDNAGKDVTHLLQDPDYHSHSDSAYELLNDYVVGRIVDEERTLTENVNDSAISLAHTASDSVVSKLGVKRRADQKQESGATSTGDVASAVADPTFLDLNKPLIPQMFKKEFSKPYYLKQVHIPRYLKEPARFFESPFLEVFTRTSWYVVPIVWLPYAAYLAYVGSQHFFLSAPVVAATVLAGIGFWTLVEYTLHRFMFHLDDWMPEWWGCYFLHFLLHGVHHFLPMDKTRLVMPPLLLALLQAPVAKFIFALLPRAYAYPFLAGAFVGYVGYDMVHYFLHHARLPTEHMRSMKTHHLAHHYKDFHQGFGITTKFWDKVFGTLETPS